MLSTGASIIALLIDQSHHGNGQESESAPQGFVPLEWTRRPLKFKEADGQLKCHSIDEGVCGEITSK